VAGRALDRLLAGAARPAPVDPQVDRRQAHEWPLHRDGGRPAVRQRERNLPLRPELAGVVRFLAVDRDELPAEGAEVRLYGVRFVHFPCFIHPDLPWLRPAFLVPSAAVPLCYAFSPARSILLKTTRRGRSCAPISSSTSSVTASWRSKPGSLASTTWTSSDASSASSSVDLNDATSP